MPTASYTWHFASDMEGWAVNTGGATGVSYGFRSTDSAPGSGGGCLYVRRDGQNLTDGYIQVRRSIPFSAMGIPGNAVITRLAATYSSRCSDWNGGAAFTGAGDVYFYSSRFGVKSGGGYRLYSGVTAWAEHPVYEARVNCLATDDASVIFELQPRTGDVAGAYVEFRGDYVKLWVDYVVPSDEPSGTPSVVIAGSPDVDISSYVQEDSLQITREANGKVSVARFTACAGMLADPLQSLLSMGTRVYIRIGSELIFDGEIANIDISTRSKLTYYSVTIRDAIALLERSAVLNLSWTSTTVGAIVADLVLNYSGGAISTNTSFIVDARQVTAFSAQADSVASALRALSNAYPSLWYLDADKVLHWRSISDPEVSGRQYSISSTATDTAALADTVSISTDMGRLANHVTVISSYDQVSTTTWSANPPASGDDGYLSGSGSLWPVSSASQSYTSGTSLQVRAANTAPSVQMTLSPASSAMSGKYGYSWPPATPYSPSNSFIESSYYNIPPYDYRVQCVGFQVNTPSRTDPILTTELIITVDNVANAGGDQQNSIWVEVASANTYNVATEQPSSGYITLPLSAGTYTVAVVNVEWGQTVYYRCGILYGQPAGINRAQITSFQVRVTYQDVANSYYEESRSLLRFDTSPIPDTATISTVALKLYAFTVSNPEWATLSLYSVSASAWPIDTTDWNPTATKLLDMTPAFGWNTIPVTPSAVNKTGYTAFLLKYSNTQPPPSMSEAVARFYSVDSGSNRPSLVVSYTTVTPGVSAVAQDTQSQATYGTRKLIIAKPGASQQECSTIASDELGKRAWPAKAVKLTAIAGYRLMPGQVVFLHFPPYLAPGFYACTGVVMKRTATGWRYELQFIGGRSSLETYLLEALK